MSFSNGLGNLQQLLGNLASKATSDGKPASLAAAAGLSSTSYDGAAFAGLKGADSTQFSSFSSVAARALSGGDVRFDKVSSLQGSIANGSYKVSSADVASKVFDALFA